MINPDLTCPAAPPSESLPTFASVWGHAPSSILTSAPALGCNEYIQSIYSKYMRHFVTHPESAYVCGKTCPGIRANSGTGSCWICTPRRSGIASCIWGPGNNSGLGRLQRPPPQQARPLWAAGIRPALQYGFNQGLFLY